MTDSRTEDVLSEVAAERQRQVTEEGWSPAHDDAHEHGQLAKAGGIYALRASLADDETSGWFGEVFARKWPWARKWWKPTNPRRDLVKAAALILAEIERLDRVAGKIAGPGSMQVQHPSPCWCPYCGEPHSPAVREQK